MINLGTNSFMDFEYNNNLIDHIDLGSTTIFDPYTELAGSLPLSFDARAAGALKDYRVHGTVSGSGTKIGIQLDAPLRGLGEYKDTLDLSTGVLTRRIGVEVLDGTKGQIPDGNTTRYFFRHISDLTVVEPTDTQIISHYVYALITTTNSELGCRVLKTSSNSTRIAIRSPNTNLDTTEKYRAFYASEYANGRPVTAYYVLANPVIEQVEVPPGLTGTIEGYLTQNGTPTESVPIYPEANGVELPNGKYEVYICKIPLSISDGTNTSSCDLYVGSTKLGEEEYVDFSEQKIYKRTVQLFNKNAPDNYIGYYLQESGGYYATSNYLVAYIPCTAGISYTMSNLSTAQSNAYIGYCDASKNVLGTIADTRIGTTDITVTAPNGAAYLAVSIRYVTTLDTAIVVEGSTAADQYYPYYEIIDPPAPFPAIQAYKGENTLRSTESVGETTVKGRLKAMYAPIEYIENTGSEYIATDILLKYADKVEVDTQITNIAQISEGWYLFGACNNSNDAEYFVQTDYARGTTCLRFYIGYTWHDGSFDMYPDYTQRGILIARHGVSSYGSTTLNTDATISVPELTFPIDIWGLNADNGTHVVLQNNKMKIYNFKIYATTNNVLAHDLAPVKRLSDNKQGLYDRVTGSFYAIIGV